MTSMSPLSRRRSFVPTKTKVQTTGLADVKTIGYQFRNPSRCCSSPMCISNLSAGFSCRLFSCADDLNLCQTASENEYFHSFSSNPLSIYDFFCTDHHLIGCFENQFPSLVCQSHLHLVNTEALIRMNSIYRLLWTKLGWSSSISFYVNFQELPF